MDTEEYDIFSTSPFSMDVSIHAVRLLYYFEEAPTVIGDVSLLDKHLERNVASLHSIASEICRGQVSISVILPRELILYHSVVDYFESVALQKWEASKVIYQKGLHIDEVVLYLEQTPEILNIAAIEKRILSEIKDFLSSFGFLVLRTIAQPNRGKYKFYPQFDATAPLLLPRQSRLSN
jgi:hypothetical protein